MHRHAMALKAQSLSLRSRNVSNYISINISSIQASTIIVVSVWKTILQKTAQATNVKRCLKRKISYSAMFHSSIKTQKANTLGERL